VYKVVQLRINKIKYRERERKKYVNCVSNSYYNMGNGMNKILPGLFIGNFRDAKDEEQIKANGITHILAAHDDAKPYLKSIKYKCVDVADNPTANLSEHFKECITFIHEARKNNGSVLVHCIAGVSRSCTLSAAYVIIVSELSWNEAIDVIRCVRECVNPNYGFQKQLQTFDLLYASKVREKLIAKYGPIDGTDKEYLNEILRQEKEANGNQPNKENAAMDPELVLGTTPTFGNYDRKKK